MSNKIFLYIARECKRLREEENSAYEHWLKVINREHTELELSEAESEYIRASAKRAEAVSLMSDLVEKGLI